jgi:hypothetical protein
MWQATSYTIQEFWLPENATGGNLMQEPHMKTTQSANDIAV